MTGFKTKKAAREAGYHPASYWRVNRDGVRRCPKRNAVPVRVKGEAFFSESQCEEMFSETAGNRRGLKLLENAEPVDTIGWSPEGGGSVTFDIYRFSDFFEAKKRRQIPPKEVDPLLAIFTVNKAAKRYRDAAQSAYQQKEHGLSKANKYKKESLYQLKDKGIKYAHHNGLIDLVGRHGAFALYRGGGFCFHSYMIPKGANPDPVAGDSIEETFKIPSQSKAKTEPRLKDAVFTLETLADIEGFEVLPKLEFPEKEYHREPVDDSPDECPQCGHQDISIEINQRDYSERCECLGCGFIWRD